MLCHTCTRKKNPCYRLAFILGVGGRLLLVLCLLLAVLRGPYGILRTEPESAAYKTSALLVVLSHWSLDWYLEVCIITVIKIQPDG